MSPGELPAEWQGPALGCVMGYRPPAARSLLRHRASTQAQMGFRMRWLCVPPMPVDLLAFPGSSVC